MRKMVCSLVCLLLTASPALKADVWKSKKKNADQKPASVVKNETSVAKETLTHELKKSVNAAEDNSVPTVDHVKQQKLGDLKSQEQHVAMLQKRLDGERAQLEQMQSDFATLYHIDLDRVKSGKVEEESKNLKSSTKTA